MEISTDATSDGRVECLHATDAIEERRTNCLQPRSGDGAVMWAARSWGSGSLPE
jgi:hypothetical protein